jgi:hypothetical protein
MITTSRLVWLKRLKAQYTAMLKRNIYLQQSDFEDISCINEGQLSADIEKNEIYESQIQHKPFNLLFIFLNFFS